MSLLCQSYSRDFNFVREPFRPWRCRTLLIVDVHTYICTWCLQLLHQLICSCSVKSFRSKFIHHLGVNSCLLPKWCSVCVVSICIFLICIQFFVQMVMAPSAVWKMLIRKKPNLRRSKMYFWWSWLCRLEFSMASKAPKNYLMWTK